MYTGAVGASSGIGASGPSFGSGATGACRGSVAAGDSWGAGATGASSCIVTACASLIPEQLVTAGALGHLLIVHSWDIVAAGVSWDTEAASASWVAVSRWKLTN